MSYQTLDTSVNVATIQQEIWKKMTPARRLAISAQMSESLIHSIRHEIEQQHPEASQLEVSQLLAKRLYGEGIFNPFLEPGN